MGDYEICRFVGSVTPYIEDVCGIYVLKIFRFAGFVASYDY